MQWAIVAGVLIVALLIAIQVTSNRPSDNASRVAYWEDLPFTGTSIGNPDAPVHVVEYFDFQCPACQQSSDLIVKPIIDKHVRAGNVYFTYRFFPVLGPESETSAIAAYCAAVQDAFWPYQDVLFSKRAAGNRGVFSRQNLINMAVDIGLDRETFAQCFDSDQARSYVRASHQHAVDLGLPGTPVFTVNGSVVRTDPATIENAIQGALAGAN